MEITIGVQHLSREIVLETESSSEEIAQAVEAALQAGTVLSLTDTRGRRILVPASTIGYVELGADSQRRIGFGAS